MHKSLLLSFTRCPRADERVPLELHDLLRRRSTYWFSSWSLVANTPSLPPTLVAWTRAVPVHWITCDRRWRAEQGLYDQWRRGKYIL